MIRTIKERVRAICSVLPFKILHKLIVTNAVYFAVLWLNAFPVKSGISDKLSPRAIVVRTILSWAKHCKLLFGAYCKVHDEKDPTNDNMPRTHASIALGPTGNFNGSYKFFCLTTGRVLKRRKWTKFPMSDRIVNKVSAWGRRTKRDVYAYG